MQSLLPLFTFIVGTVLGTVATAVLLRRQHARQTQLAATIQTDTDERVERRLRETFESLAAGALQANSQHLLQLSQTSLTQHTQAASQQLDSKQQLITTSLTELRSQLGQQLNTVTERLAQLEKERHSQYSALGQQLQATHQQLSVLATTTGDLKSALSNARVRGQWGERMADDVLRLAGLQEHVSYRRQATLAQGQSGESTSRGRPDLTFLLPGHKVIHMDVKFPLDGYLAYLEATDDSARDRAKKSFLQAARQRIRETATRDYRSSATAQGEQPLDYVLVFIPNEQVYAFMLEHAPDLLGEAISQKVILCSPTTLLAVLAVIRQAMENFSLEQRTAELQTLIATFRDQWFRFMDAHDGIGKAINSLQDNFQKLMSTRRNMLERPLNKLTAHHDHRQEDLTSTPALLNVTTPPPGPHN